MPFSYQLEPSRRLVLSRVWGVLTETDIEEYYARLAADPGFDPAMRQLCHIMDATRIDASAEALRRLAQRSIFSPGTRRAIVAVQDAHYGLSRMFKVFSEVGGSHVEVFRDSASAEAWLELGAVHRQLR